ncbi:roquin-2-like [Salvelinus sp. IW2-2015]|uniref:roquin-2-like n=1 Tax=Salvelinus sp. IW2-2015 TaxID=2691554 RepID=UPI0038D3BE54
MPVQAAQWTEFLSCPICYNEFDSSGHKPISLGCSHTVCKTCLQKLHRKACPFDQTAINTDIDLLPVNSALLQLVGAQGVVTLSPSVLSRPMQRKLVTLVNCQLVEEEGRLRAVRAGRSLGERTVTELILQHQNPQQLSANLWAAVRARGCQFLGPATQEDALKLVLLALEDGSALSRKVLVLFVVQKLEARFPQASKTSIGHVVQLLYRASCFKVRPILLYIVLYIVLYVPKCTYDARDLIHKSHMQSIIDKVGDLIHKSHMQSIIDKLGDLIHKSHMQSIIDKLQSPESFAKSVQELTIVLQRTGDPANLNSLRPQLELLANIDHNPGRHSTDQSTPFSSGPGEPSSFPIHPVHLSTLSTLSISPPSPFSISPSSPSLHPVHLSTLSLPLSRNRMRNKKISGVGRPFPLAQGSMGSEGGDSGEEACTGGLKSSDKGGSGSLKEGATPSQLIPRGGDMMEEMKRERSVLNGSTGSSRSSSGSMEQKSISPPKTPVNSSSAPSPYGPGSRLECDSAHPKQAHYLMIRPLPQPPPHQPQSSELCYQDPRPPYDVQPYQPASNGYPSAIHNHKPCVARFLRSSHVPESSLPPSMAPLYSEQYPSLPPPRDHAGPSPYSPPPVPQYGPLAPAHGGYAPLYDSRHMWRPQLYHREDTRSNSLPPEVLHSSVYQPPLRERYASLDSPYCSAGEHRAALNRVQLLYSLLCKHAVQDSLGVFLVGCEDLLQRKQEQWAHHHHGNVNRPSQSSPSSPLDLWCRMRIPHTVETYRRLKDEDPSIPFETYRRLKDKDPSIPFGEGPIIPFGEGPIISKWGAISRASRTGYHTTDPVQATACQGSNSTIPINFRGEEGMGDWSSNVKE